MSAEVITAEMVWRDDEEAIFAVTILADRVERIEFRPTYLAGRYWEDMNVTNASAATVAALAQLEG